MQAMVWEQYPSDAGLDALLAGNSAQMAFKVNPVERIDPPLAPRDNVLLNKTGSTGGFGAYVVLLPAEAIGVVMLANRNVPIPDRVTATQAVIEMVREHRSRR